MSARVVVVYWIISAVGVSVESAQCFGGEVVEAVGRKKPPYLAVVVSTVKIPQFCFVVKMLTKN